MRRRNLTELAGNPDLIPGIYNYCDRWCERCPLALRCLVYATEAEDDDAPASRDTHNEAFWKKLGSIFEETRAMMAEWGKEAGVNLNELVVEDEARPQRHKHVVDNHPLAKAGKKYANAASDWFREFDHEIEADAGDAREVIQWYQYQIAVKTIRALSGRTEEVDAKAPKDSDGSAKVALIGIDRSIAAWRLMQLSLPEHAQSIVSLILQLEMLRIRLEHAFPKAREFVRPGFDEVLAK